MFREHQAPTDIPVAELEAGALRLAKLLATQGLAPSVSEAQRLISQGGVKVDNEPVTDLKFEIGARSGEEHLIQVGKRKFLRVIFR
jgi:tyrosyl-tRNA synthetase